MKQWLIFFSGIFILLSCNNENKSVEQTSTDSTDITQPIEPKADFAADSVAIRNTITDFYSWYKKNFLKFTPEKLYSGIKSKEYPPYKINWDQVERYHTYIRNNIPQLGETFILNQKHFFQECDSAFKADKKEEMPYGFDYDWYTNSQEDPQYMIDEMNKSPTWKTSVNGDEATVDVMTWQDANGRKKEEALIEFKMKKEGGRWTIAQIINPW